MHEISAQALESQKIRPSDRRGVLFARNFGVLRADLGHFSIMTKMSDNATLSDIFILRHVVRLFAKYLA
jgi:hypothetical protein